MSDASHVRHQGRESAAPVTGRQAVLQRYQRHVNRSFATLAKLMSLPVEVYSTGCLVYNENDEAYLDCGGYGVFLMGHCHPKVIEAVKTQLERHPLSTRTLLNAELAAAAEALVAVAPSGMAYAFFANSGAEATELSIKLARLHGKHKLLAMQGGYHGKTMGALSITDRPQFQNPFRPLLPDVRFVPYGEPDALEVALAQDGNQTCVILEPVQGEGGVVIPPTGYLRQVYGLCQHYDALLILDEIQTGLGRLGSWWGADRDGITPDILLVGKGLSGGAVPVSAVVATPQIFEPLNNDFLVHSSTFAGNPLATTAARAAIEVIQEENLVDRARVLGELLLPTIRQIVCTACPECIVGVRGVGLLLGIEFQRSDLAGEFMMKLLEQRVIVSHSLNTHRVIRLTPPALLSNAQCDWLFTAIEAAAYALHKRGFNEY